MSLTAALEQTVGEREDAGVMIERIREMDDIDALRGIREACDRRLLGSAHQDERGYRLRQHLRTAMIGLRAAEDYARLHMHRFPTADRIRAIHQQLSDDVINGVTYVPSAVDVAREQWAVTMSEDF